MAGYPERDATDMSLRSKILAAAATLTLVGALGAAGATAGTARAATPSCGPTCIDIFSKNFGTATNPQFTVDVFRQSQKTGQPVILFRESNADPALDWTISNDGQVSDFYAAGLVSAELALHYGCNGVIVVAGASIPCAPTGAVDDYAFEDQYSPFGVDSGLCAGVASTAFQNEGVSLQPCGVSARTVWVVDTLDSCPTNPLYSAELPLINGSDLNFSHPFVATYPAAGFPTDKPRPQLIVQNLTGFSQSGGGSGLCGGSAVVGPDNNQLWSAVAGVLP
jgi:hypothetical protein